VRLEHTGAYDVAQRNFDVIEALAVTAGDQSAQIRFGTATLTWPGGSPRGDNVSVSHGLARTPVVVLVTASTGVGASTTVFPVVAVRGGTMTSTTVELTAVTSDGSSPAAATEATVHWLAVG
jgi:hypothetical protein